MWTRRLQSNDPAQLPSHASSSSTSPVRKSLEDCSPVSARCELRTGLQFNVGDVREKERMKRRKREGQEWDSSGSYCSLKSTPTSVVCHELPVFSQMKIIKSKYRTTLTNDHPVACNQLVGYNLSLVHSSILLCSRIIEAFELWTRASYNPDFETLASSSQCQRSH